MSRIPRRDTLSQPGGDLRKDQSDGGVWRVQKWLAIWNVLVDPRPAREIAVHTGLAQQIVYNLISRYNLLGSEVVKGPGKGGYSVALSPFSKNPIHVPKVLTLSGELTYILRLNADIQVYLFRSTH